MARAPTLVLRVEDFPPEVQGWIKKLLSPLTRFSEEISAALSGRLTLSENLAMNVIDVDVQMLSERHALSLNSGWVAMPDSGNRFQQPPVVRKSDDGFVYVHGAAKGGTAGTSAFSLPATMRPAAEVVFPVVGSFAGYQHFYRCRIDRDGQVWIGEEAGGTCDWVHVCQTFEAADPTPTVNGSFPLSVAVSLPGSAQVGGVVPIRAIEVISSREERGVGCPISVDWTTSGSNLIITDIPGLLAGKRYRVTMLVYGE